MSHVAHNESYHTYVWVMSHTWRMWWVWYVSFIGDEFICVRIKSPYVWHDSFLCVTWLILMCDMTHSYVWYVSFISHDHHIWMRRMWRMWDVSSTCHEDSCDWQDWGLTVEALPPRGGGSAECPKRTRGEWDAGVENKNTQNTQINLNKWKLGEP